jgi:DNA-binding transcriptional LysR family regulator
MLVPSVRYLKAVADHGSFTRAAAALHVSQPALSQQIRELEERMGVQLLDRGGRTVRPTDVGEAYLPMCGGRLMSWKLAGAQSAMFRTCRAVRCVSALPLRSRFTCSDR